MRVLDHGPDGINDEAFDREMGKVPRSPRRRTPIATPESQPPAPTQDPISRDPAVLYPVARPADEWDHSYLLDVAAAAQYDASWTLVCNRDLVTAVCRLALELESQLSAALAELEACRARAGGVDR